MTHAELVDHALRWLRGTQRCPVAVASPGGGLEIPDAIGWRSGGRMSILVECKASRADFLRDKKKWHRQHGLGVGQRRYYMAPPGIITPADLPPGWGLVEVVDGVCHVRTRLPKVTTYDPAVWDRERGMLFSALTRALAPHPAALTGTEGPC